MQYQCVDGQTGQTMCIARLYIELWSTTSPANNTSSNSESPKHLLHLIRVLSLPVIPSIIIVCRRLLLTTLNAGATGMPKATSSSGSPRQTGGTTWRVVFAARLYDANVLTRMAGWSINCTGWSYKRAVDACFMVISTGLCGICNNFRTLEISCEKAN